MSEFNDVLNKKAVALTYDEDKKAAPVIVASGMGYLAQKIVETAEQNGVPVYEDNSLATMLTQLDLGSEIPEELYKAIVDIYVYFLNYKPLDKRVGDAGDKADSPENIKEGDALPGEKELPDEKS